MPEIGDGDPFPVLASSLDGHVAVAARSDPRFGRATVGVIETSTDKFAFQSVVVEGPVTSIAFLPNQLVAMAIGEEGPLVVLDAATGSAGRCRGRAFPRTTSSGRWTQSGVGGRRLRRPRAVAVAGDEMLVGAADGSVRVFDPATLEVVRTLELGAETSPASGHFPTEPSLRPPGSAWRGPPGNGRRQLDRPEFERCVNLTVDEPRGAMFCGDPYGRLEERRLINGAVVRRPDAQNGNSGSLWTANSEPSS